MSPRSNRRASHRQSRPRRSGKRLWRFIRRRSHEMRAFLGAVCAAHPAIAIPVTALLLGVTWFGINWAYHAAKKPSEILFPLDNAFDKNLTETWREYGPLFREHATAAITPELLAALAQVEGSGNPLARTYWRWHSSWNPLQWYRPASSAVGMFQITSGTFQAAKRYCIHDHVVTEDGPWHDIRSCWFNGLYTRVLPSHAIELTAALLDRQVAQAIGSRSGVTSQQKQELAAIIHLCGASVGQAYVSRGFRLPPRQNCGEHEVRTYLRKVSAAKQQFARLATAAQTTSWK